MAAAATQMPVGTIYQIEYAASSGLKHHLGLTCDPVAGLVQINCIERNAFGAQRAVDSAVFAYNSDGRYYVHFDQVVEVMKQTGKDLPSFFIKTENNSDTEVTLFLKSQKTSQKIVLLLIYLKIFLGQLII